MAGRRLTATRQTSANGGGVLVTTTAEAGDNGVYLTVDESLSIWEVQERVRAIMLELARRQSNATTVATLGTGANGY